MEGLLRNYKENLDSVEMAEPTNFSEVLVLLDKEIIQTRKEAASKKASLGFELCRGRRGEEEVGGGLHGDHDHHGRGDQVA